MKFNVENKLINAIGFQAAWWATVLYSQLSTLPVFALVLLHLFLLKKNRLQEILFVLAVSVLGIAMDSLLAVRGIFVFNEALGFGFLVPTWLMALWFAFACTLNHCLAWLFKKKIVLLVVGGVGGALSYIGAVKFGSFSLAVPPDQAFYILAVCWGIFFVLISLLRSAFNFEVEK